MTNIQTEFVFQIIGVKDGRRSQDMTGTMTQIKDFCELMLEKHKEQWKLVEENNCQMLEAVDIEDVDSLQLMDFPDHPENDYILLVGSVTNDMMKVINAPLFTIKSLLNKYEEEENGVNGSTAGASVSESGLPATQESPSN